MPHLSCRAIPIAPKAPAPGVPVLEYRSDNNNLPKVYRALAPSLGCEIMDDLELRFGKFGVPQYVIRYRITSYKLKEPDKKLFELPAGYKQ